MLPGQVFLSRNAGYLPRLQIDAWWMTIVLVRIRLSAATAMGDEFVEIEKVPGGRRDVSLTRVCRARPASASPSPSTPGSHGLRGTPRLLGIPGKSENRYTNTASQLRVATPTPTIGQVDNQRRTHRSPLQRTHVGS
jgi:hypothetical protein